jgi:hypothetical protein
VNSGKVGISQQSRGDVEVLLAIRGYVATSMSLYAIAVDIASRNSKISVFGG